MTSVIKPYKTGDYNWSDPTIRFTNAKKHIEAGTSVFLDEDLKEVLDYMEKIRLGAIDDPVRIKDFIINDLALLTQIILSRNFRIMIELQMQGKLQPFLFKVLFFCLEYLPQNYPGLFEIIQLILNNNHNYYSHNPYYQAHDVADELYRKFPPTFNICPVSESIHAGGTHIVSQIAKMEFDDALKRMNPQCLAYKIVKDIKYPDTNFIKSSCIYQKISIVYLVNLNYFIQIGGHEAIFEYMKSFHTMNNLLPSLNFFYNLATFLEDDFYQQQIVPHLTEVLKELPKTLNKEEIKHAKKDDINNLFQILQNVLKNSKNRAATSESLTLYELDILLVYLKSQYMEKRIFAITTLVEKIPEAESHQEEYDSLQKHLAKRNEQEGEENKSNTEKDLTSVHWFRKENYLNWLKENQVVNVLLGESSHAEVLRRSSPLFRFLFRNKELSLKNVEAICDLAIEKHDTFRKHILTILGDLAELMDTDQLQHLFEKIRNLSAQELDQDVLQLIKTIGNHSIPKREEEAGSPSTRNNKDRYKDKDDENSYKITINEETTENYYNQGTKEDMEAFIGSEVVGKNTKVYVELSPEAREKGEKLAREIVEYLWRIIIGKNSNQQMIGNATSIVKEMMSEKLEKERLIFVEKAVLAINQNVALTESFEILQYVLKGKFPIQKQDGTLLHSKRDLIVFLENEYSISNTLFNSMILLKSDLVSCLAEKGDNEEVKEEDIRSPANNNGQEISSAKIRLASLGEGTTEEELYKVYLKEVEERLKFIRMLKNNSFEKLELKHAKLMWELLVENAIYESERDLFFGTFNSIIYYANDESKILSEEIINYIFFDVLLAVDFSSYTLPIFYCFEEFFKHLNKHCNVIKLDYHEFKVRSLDLIGFDFLWELYLNCPDQKIVQKAQSFILKLSTHLIDKSSRVSFIETAVKHVRKAYENIKENLSLAPPDNESIQRISRSLDFISGFLQEYGELHIHRGKQNPADAIQVTIFNQLPSAQAPKKFSITLYKTMTLTEAKNFIASKVTPAVAPKEITLISRGSILDNEGATLDELKIQNDQTIFCTKSTLADDTEMQPIALMGPEPMPQNEDAADVYQKIENIQAFMPHLETDFVKWVLKRKNYDVDDAATSLLDPGLEDFYRREFEKEEKEEKQQVAKVQEITTNKQEGGSGEAFKGIQPSMSQSLSNNIETLNLFFELLGLQSADIEAKVWNLLVNLPLNTEIYESIKNVFGANEYEDFETIIDWPSVLDPQSTSKLLYSLQIVNTFIACESDESGNNEEALNKAAWRINFLRNEGFGYLLNFVTKISESNFLKISENQGENDLVHNTEAKTLQLILNILKIYVHSALVAKTPFKLQKVLRSTLDFNKPEIVVKNKKNEKKKQSTPTFGPQPNPSREEENSRDNNDDNPYANNASSSSGLNNVRKEEQGKEQVQEFEDLVVTMKQYDNYLVEKALEFNNLKELLRKILGIIKASLDFIDKDGDLASLVESAFSFILPCFVTYPQLLESLYDYEGTEGILRTIFFESQQEAVKTKLTQLISFLSLHFNELITQQGQNDIEEWKLDDSETGKAVKVEIGSPQNFFLRKLLPLVYSCNTNDRVTLEYFQMLSNLIHISDRETVNNITDLSRLYAFSIRFIIDRPILEDRSSEYQDKILAGFLLLAQNLVEIEPTLREFFQNSSPLLEEFSLENTDLLKELYNFLFYLPTENEKSGASLGPPKCKHVQTRQHVFKLLRELCQGNQENLKRTLDLLSQNHKKLPYFSFDDNQTSSSTSMLNSELKNTTGYVGMKNLGCTCYMNSLIQQFFMILPLRNTVLNSEVKVKLKRAALAGQPELTENKSSLDDGSENQEVEVFLSQLTREVYEANKKEIQPQLNDNTLYQLQVLLAHLAESASEYVYPTQFFNSIKTINGEKIVLNVQQDVNEFFNTLCDKLDVFMKGTPQQTALPDLIGGMLSHEIISLEKDYPYYAEREEAYLTLPLDIKNKSNINEAMNLFVKEDILEGDNKYFCEKYNRKIKVMKRCCIKTLPNTLIITLKRFDFDFNLMQKVKINDFFEFPLSFNIKPWTIVGLKDQIPPEANFELPEYPDSYYKYELAGVLVHSGTAEGGHYYSFIKDRSGASKGWFEFNDNKVTPFEMKNLKTECFGAEGSGSHSVYDDFDLTHIKSAYILFYERTVEESSETLVKYKDQGVNKTLSQIIWSENIELLRTKYFYNVDYFNFMLDLVKFYEFSEVKAVPSSYSEYSVLDDDLASSTVGKGSEELLNGDKEELYGGDIKVLKMAIILASEIYLKNKDADGFARWIKLIENVLDRFIPASIWLIKLIISHPDFLNLIYLEEVSGIVKEAVRDLLSKVINLVHNIESPYFNEEQTITENQREVKKVRRSSLARFLLYLRQEFRLDTADIDFSKPIKKLNIIPTLIKLNQHIAHYLIEAGFLKTYFELFITMQRALTASSVSALARDKDLYNSQNTLMIFQAIEALIRACVTDSMQKYDSVAPTYLFGDKVDWSKCPRVPANIIKDLQDNEILKKLLMPMQEKCDNLIQIAQHVSWQNKEASRRIVLLLIGFTCSFLSDPKDVEESMKIVYHLVKLEDHYQADRIECVFSKEGPKTGSCARDEDIILSMKKAKDHYAKGQTILALRWLAMMAAENVQVKYFIQQNSEKFEWAIEFLHEQVNLKYPIYGSVDDNMKVKMPTYVKKAYDLLLDTLPIFKAPVEKIEEIPEDIPERNEVTGPIVPKGHKNKEENLFSIIDTPDDE